MRTELEKDAIAIYQVADDLYSHQRYRIEQGRSNKSGEPAIDPEQGELVP